METIHSEKAFSNPNHTYYRTTKEIGFLPKGTIFVHDEDDKLYGSIAKGCIKLCWTPSGNCVGNDEAKICGGTVIFHYSFIEHGGLFEEVEEEKTEIELLKDRIIELERQQKSLSSMVLDRK